MVLLNPLVMTGDKRRVFGRRRKLGSPPSFGDRLEICAGTVGFPFAEWGDVRFATMRTSEASVHPPEALIPSDCPRLLP